MFCTHAPPTKISESAQVAQVDFVAGHRHWEPYRIDETVYWARAYYQAGLESVISAWEDGTLREVQRLHHPYIMDICHFVISGTHFLAAAAFKDESGSSRADSPIYAWYGTEFAEFQKLPTIGAADLEHFVIDNTTYLAVMNFQDGSDRAQTSVIYRWNGSGFEDAQGIPTSGGRRARHFQIDSVDFLAVLNENGAVAVYRWAADKFALKQSISTANFPLVLEPFSSNDLHYLAIGGTSSTSSVYVWSGSEFQLLGTINTPGGVYDLHAFWAEGTQYLATALWKQRQSTIFALNGTGFEERFHVDAFSATDWSSFTASGTVYLAVANSDAPSEIFRFPTTTSITSTQA